MPTIKFAPTFLNDEPITVTISEGASLLDAAVEAGVPMGDACGGNCGCSTCHVFVVVGVDSLSEMEDDEDDILGKADDVRMESRLGCQAMVGDTDLVVEISRESQQSFINEHPEYRDRAHKIK